MCGPIVAYAPSQRCSSSDCANGVDETTKLFYRIVMQLVTLEVVGQSGVFIGDHQEIAFSTKTLKNGPVKETRKQFSGIAQYLAYCMQVSIELSENV